MIRDTIRRNDISRKGQPGHRIDHWLVRGSEARQVTRQLSRRGVVAERWTFVRQAESLIRGEEDVLSLPL